MAAERSFDKLRMRDFVSVLILSLSKSELPKD
jgi:hypothetical protein